MEEADFFTPFCRGTMRKEGTQPACRGDGAPPTSASTPTGGEHERGRSCGGRGAGRVFFRRGSKGNQSAGGRRPWAGRVPKSSLRSGSRMRIPSKRISRRRARSLIAARSPTTHRQPPRTAGVANWRAVWIMRASAPSGKTMAFSGGAGVCREVFR